MQHFHKNDQNQAGIEPKLFILFVYIAYACVS